MLLLRQLLVICFTIVVACPASQAQYSLNDINPASEWVQPLEMVSVPGEGEQYLIVAQPGIIHLFDRASGESQTFLDIRGRVSSGGETGLLGLALHPGYTTNGYFYVYYTRHAPGLESCVSQFQVNPEQPAQVLEGSEQELMVIAQPLANHNGGKIAFGPDGYLYIATGDGGGAGDPGNNAQNLGNLLGKILRIDVDAAEGEQAYSIPEDNPFLGTAGARPEIFAYGLRNPWKFSFDEETGTLWAADVGQNQREEINIIEPGGNYGWRIQEGTFCYTPAENCAQDGLIPPVWEYEHGATTGRSVTGGFIYRGNDLPGLQGQYIFGDFISGRVWALNYTDETPSASLLIESPHRIAAFAEAKNGEVFVLAHSNGKIYQLTSVPSSLGSLRAPTPLLKVYPNPSNGEFRVETGQPLGAGYRVQLYDAKGSEIKVDIALFERKTGALHVRLPLLVLRPGIYMLKITDAQQVYRARVILQSQF
jgi:glucose/arabinose dehydrogenase